MDIGQSKVEIDCIIYLLNENEKTAYICGHKRAKGDIFIPRSIIHNTKEYIVKSILKESFNFSMKIKSIQFAPDSQVDTIEGKIFLISSIESITIPSSLVEPLDKLFVDVSSLIKINVYPNHPRYSVYDDKFVIGKSKIDQENYDILVFLLQKRRNSFHS